MNTIILEHLSKTYPGGKKAVNQIDLSSDTSFHTDSFLSHKRTLNDPSGQTFTFSFYS